MTSVARREHDDSGEYSDASQDIENSNSLNDGQPESDYDSRGSESDRSDRDPENQETERRVDDDEDRSNPQYIPKRGTFYEHDDRTAASGEDANKDASETALEKKEGSETPSERRRAPRKSDIVNKWSHDKYIENEQIPKTRDELVSIYGYDIRNEEAPPHARRNRRYGRGPNKYTRTWEDEEAYRRQNAVQPRKPPNPEDFPELEASARKPGRKPRMQRPRSKSQPASNDSMDSDGPQLRRNASIKTPRPKPVARPAAPVKSAPPKNTPKPQDKLPNLENLTITTNLNNSQGQGVRKVTASVAQQRPVPTDFGRKKPNNQSQQHQNNSVPNSKPSQPQQQQQKPQQQQNQQQPTETRTGSKRYSSLRQRPLGDNYTPQTQQQQQISLQQPAQQQQQQQSQPQQHRYHSGAAEYPNGGNQPPSSGNAVQHAQQHPQHMMHPVHRNATAPHAPSPPHQQLPHPQQQLPQQQLPQQQLPQQQLPQQQIQQQTLPQQQLPQQQLPQQPHAQQVRLGLLEQQQLVPHHTLHNMPQAHSIAQIPPPAQGYAPPAMMPAQYMQQSGSAPVYGAGAMFTQPPPAAYSHQMYQHHNYATQAGGVTYYNCAEQEQPPLRAHRRPTAAIPIVRPQPLDRPANSSEKDNIDRIVENMFVRKPWPAAQGNDKEKSTESRSSQEPPSKESSQPNSLTSSSVSIDSKPSDNKEEKPEVSETKEQAVEIPQDSIPTDA